MGRVLWFVQVCGLWVQRGRAAAGECGAERRAVVQAGLKAQRVERVEGRGSSGWQVVDTLLLPAANYPHTKLHLPLLTIRSYKATPKGSGAYHLAPVTVAQAAHSHSTGTTHPTPILAATR